MLLTGVVVWWVLLRISQRRWAQRATVTGFKGVQGTVVHFDSRL